MATTYTAEQMLEDAIQELAEVTARYGANSHFASEAKMTISYARTEITRTARKA